MTLPNLWWNVDLFPYRSLNAKWDHCFTNRSVWQFILMKYASLWHNVQMFTYWLTFFCLEYLSPLLYKSVSPHCHWTWCILRNHWTYLNETLERLSTLNCQDSINCEILWFQVWFPLQLHLYKDLLLAVSLKPVDISRLLYLL